MPNTDQNFFCENQTNTFQIRAIGIIHSPYSEQSGTPIQARFSKDAQGQIELYPEYSAALKDLDGFERLWALFLLHRARPWKPLVTPYLDKTTRGLFSTRAPSRPNPLGLSALFIKKIENNIIHVKGLDILDQTPLLDIKPYIPAFDAFADSSAGWFDRVSQIRQNADERFSPID